MGFAQLFSSLFCFGFLLSCVHRAESTQCYTKAAGLVSVCPEGQFCPYYGDPRTQQADCDQCRTWCPE
eukprot:1896181-Rhodomonas_salina.1